MMTCSIRSRSPRTQAGAAGRKTLRTDAAGQRFHGHMRFPDDAGVVDIFAEAPDTVSAHFRFASVAVENLHADIFRIAVSDHKDAVRADAGVAVAHPNRQRRIVRAAGERASVDDEEIISKPVHFGEEHVFSPFQLKNSTNASSA